MIQIKSVSEVSGKSLQYRGDHSYDLQVYRNVRRGCAFETLNPALSTVYRLCCSDLNFYLQSEKSVHLSVAVDRADVSGPPSINLRANHSCSFKMQVHLGLHVLVMPLGQANDDAHSVIKLKRGRRIQFDQRSRAPKPKDVNSALQEDQENKCSGLRSCKQFSGVFPQLVDVID